MPTASRASRPFFTVPAVTLARRLLGCTLVRVLDSGERVAGVIVETEAYIGPEDLASHARGNRRTARTEPMFAVGGTSYVYLTYGMHFMLNIAAGRADHPAAVLIRALRPTLGEEHMRLARAAGDRRLAAKLADSDLCRGPARLAQALSIDFSLNALDLTTERRLFIEVPIRREKVKIARSARIGVQNSGAWANTPLRFFDANSRFVSGPKAPPVYPDAIASPKSRPHKVRRKVG